MTARTLVFVALIITVGCSTAPTAPSGPVVAGRGGGSVTIAEINPAAGETIDAFVIPRVTVRYSLESNPRDPRIWMCLGQTATSVILSSCRDTRVGSSTGTAENYPGVFFINKRRVVPETRFIASFLADGDIVERRSTYPPFELAYDKLTPHILALDTVEHVWRWGDIP